MRSESLTWWTIHLPRIKSWRTRFEVLRSDDVDLISANTAEIKGVIHRTKLERKVKKMFDFHPSLWYCLFMMQKQAYQSTDGVYFWRQFTSYHLAFDRVAKLENSLIGRVFNRQCSDQVLLRAVLDEIQQSENVKIKRVKFDDWDITRKNATLDRIYCMQTIDELDHATFWLQEVAASKEHTLYTRQILDKTLVEANYIKDSFIAKQNTNK